MSELSCTTDQMELADFNRAFLLVAAEYTFFSSFGTFFAIDHTLGHKRNKKISKT